MNLKYIYLSIILIIIIIASLIVANTKIVNWEITFGRPYSGILFFILCLVSLYEDGIIKL